MTKESSRTESRTSRILKALRFTVAPNYRHQTFVFFFRWFFRDYYHNFLHQLTSNNWIIGGTLATQMLRPFLYRCRGVSIGRSVSIGDRTTIGLTCPEYISIGNYCRISNGVLIVEHGRNLDNYGPGRKVTDLPVEYKSVIIEDDCHLGAGAIILPGVRIGRGAIIGAGSVVRKNVAPYALVAGNPAVTVFSFDAVEK